MLYLPAKACKKGFDSGLCLKNRTMAVHRHTPPYHHVSTSKQGVKGTLPGNFGIQYTNMVGNFYLLKIDCTIIPRNSRETSVIHHFMLMHLEQSFSIMIKCRETNLSVSIKNYEAKYLFLIYPTYFNRTMDLKTCYIPIAKCFLNDYIFNCLV